MFCLGSRQDRLEFDYDVYDYILGGFRQVPLRIAKDIYENVYHLPSLEDPCTTTSTTSVNHYR